MERRGRRADRGARRVDVVDEQDAPADGVGPEGSANISPARVAREAALRAQGPRPAQERSDRQPPEPGELAGETLGRMVPTAQAAVAVGRDERDQLCGRRLDDLGDDRGGKRGEPSEAMLLPGGDDGANRRVVLDRRPGGGEREPTARAFAAAGDRPGGRGPTSRAERA